MAKRTKKDFVNDVKKDCKKYFKDGQKQYVKGPDGKDYAYYEADENGNILAVEKEDYHMILQTLKTDKRLQQLMIMSIANFYNNLE